MDGSVALDPPLSHATVLESTDIEALLYLPRRRPPSA